MHFPPHLKKVIETLKQLPGIGSKSAERFAFQMLDWKPEKLQDMAAAIGAIPDKLGHCPECGCLIGEEDCPICRDEKRKTGVLCVVASPKDVFPLEQTRQFKGLYHVLGGLLSPMNGINPGQLNLAKLRERIASRSITEVIIALDSTLEGDATALYLKKELAPLEVGISRLALGLPMGSSLDYIDSSTLSRALSGRSSF